MQNHYSDTQSTIVAAATPAGGALGIVRLSGPQAIEICGRVFRSGASTLADSPGYTLHYGSIWGTDGFIDEVVVSLYRAPRSYTGEDMIEISCHGSGYVMGRLLELFIEQGARAAQAGEFTIRAFLAGKLDLSQAEAVADMIASSDRASHALASTQMRGGYSHELAVLREQLLGLAALLELELDFSEEDVEFADRSQLMRTIDELDIKIYALAETFRLGNAIKEGIPVAITGPPNAGKSTLLNALLNEERAMVSDIEGTTRDTIEESVNIGGLRFRFIDTAGIRETGDRLERMGIERTYDSAAKADVVLYLVEAEDVVRLVGGAAGDGACGVACGVAGSGPDDVACGVACGVAEDVEAVDEIVSEAASNAVPEAVPKAVADAAPKAVADAVALASLISIAEHIYRLKLREDQRLCLIVNKIDSYSAPEKIAGMEQLLKDTLNCILQNCPDGLGDKGNSAADIGENPDNNPDNNLDINLDNRVVNYICKNIDNVIAVSAKTRANIGRLTDYMSQLFDTEMAFGGGTVVSNARHLEALRNARQSLERVREGLLCGIPSDLLTRDIGDTLFHIGTITGEITTDDVLGSIFSKFCIGK